MVVLDPNYPQIVLSFHYRGFEIQIDRQMDEDGESYAAWANYSYGCAIAVPQARHRTVAIQRAKAWVDRRCRQK
ncbi:MAG: hypothetical protein SAJ12_10555 [Jaaginema sp. PMC 1079.18]|nr:hypothetical protein [Jaaginema sp. PMC 1080.18]MEC4851442.1 hypothetical protein [Jaaginema sp. PMC 1079.18]MEC4868255.1 hypothetical protein [Jaaginema sp. PMC 1078.18]